MCGIFGIVYRDTERTVSETWVHEVIASMAHRGPDGEGVFVGDSVGLGHRRLSIIDLESGHQPMFNEDGSIVVVFNGEIYNFPELRDRLQALGHTFKTHCDTEVIVHGYEQWGERCVRELRGMFAFAVYDRRRKEMFIARDRVGIKPLYFFHDATCFVFASEVKALLASQQVKAIANRSAIDAFINLGYVPAPGTMFSGIHKVCPGETLLLRADFSIAKERYWDLRFPARPERRGSKPDEAEFKQLLTDCVRSHLISDVPLGAFLSGGLDSSAIVAIMSRVLQVPVKTFSVGYRDDAASELRYARRVAEYFGTEHHEFVLDAVPFFDSLDALLQFTEEPLVESAAIALYQLSRLAKTEATVLLSGEGADELLAGYGIYGKMSRIEKLHSILSAAQVTRFVPRGPAFLPEVVRKYLHWLKHPFERRYRTVPADVAGTLQEEMYTPGFRTELGSELDELFARAYEPMRQNSMLQKMLYVDTKYWLTDDLLLKADKSTMAASIELRVPFLDHVLLEYAAALPDEHKNDGRTGKILLRKVMKTLLPEDILQRKKMGFPVPIGRWFKNQLREKVAEILLDPKTTARGYFKRSYVENVLGRHNTGYSDNSRRILSLLVLELWHRKYIDAG